MVVQPEFSYEEMVKRNIGFVTFEEQSKLRNAHVFVCGVGGMGGACLQSLVRCGISKITIADIDVFEVSNLNRQVFATNASMGELKTISTQDSLKAINPELEIEVLGADWLNDLWKNLRGKDVIVNGMDDLRSAIELYRAARALGIPVVDAYTSMLPSVYVTTPKDPTPEERYSCKSVGLAPTNISSDMVDQLKFGELEFVLTHSSTMNYIDTKIASEIVSGKRSRISFAPMVITTGNLMAYEVINVALDKKSAAGHLGYFFNPYKGCTERPSMGPKSFVKARLVRAFLEGMSNGK
jgi:molybdopterin-synthase adenylyltransferase